MRAERRNAGRGVLAMLAFGAAALVAVALAGRPGTPAQVHVALVDSVALTDDDGGQALFGNAQLAPGRSVSRCLRVGYAGPGAPGPVRLVATDLSGRLLPHLSVRVAAGTGGGFASCAGFTGTALVYDGPLAGLAGGTATAPGVPTGWDPAPDDARTFQVTVAVDGTATPGQTAGGTFAWVLLTAVPTKVSPSSPAAPPKPARPARTGAPVLSPRWFAEQAQQLFHGGLVVAGRIARHGELPVGWLVALVVFLAVQNRIDGRDPKLALAPVWRDPEVGFPETPTPYGEVADR